MGDIFSVYGIKEVDCFFSNYDGDTIDYYASEKEKIDYMKKLFKNYGYRNDSDEYNKIFWDEKFYEKYGIIRNNTYNIGDNFIPRDFIYALYEIDGRYIAMVSIHTGVDIRGGYTFVFYKEYDSKEEFFDELSIFMNFVLRGHIYFEDGGVVEILFYDYYHFVYEVIKKSKLAKNFYNVIYNMSNSDGYEIIGEIFF